MVITDGIPLSNPEAIIPKPIDIVGSPCKVEAKLKQTSSNT